MVPRQHCHAHMSMKIAILAGGGYTFVPILAQSLHRMLSKLGVHSSIFEDLSSLDVKFNKRLFLPKSKSSLLKTYRALRALRLCAKLSTYDAIVVTGNIPSMFLRNRYNGIELIRSILPKKPIILYSNYYLPTMYHWYKYLKNGSAEHEILEGNNYGLERFDWYLCTSVVTEVPLPDSFRAHSHIGIDIDDGTLYPSKKKEFFALIDFERTGCMSQKFLQIEALEETKTKYYVLHGRYSIENIRKIYRNTSIYFLAHVESFGLPICELQACGAYIFAPDSKWCLRHQIKPDLYSPGPGYLPENFVIYGDKNDLVEKINQTKRTYNPKRVFNSFLQNHPQLYYGDVEELEEFVGMLKRNEIHSGCHRQYTNYVYNLALNEWEKL